MTESPWDFGTWRCEACGENIPGERGEPPLHHVHECEDANGNSLVFEEQNSDDDQQQSIDENTCDLCGDEAGYLHSITSEPRLPSRMQTRLSICSGCRDALEAVEDDECAWCGAGNASTVTVVGSRDGDYSIGQLCLDCQGVENDE